MIWRPRQAIGGGLAFSGAASILGLIVLLGLTSSGTTGRSSRLLIPTPLQAAAFRPAPQDRLTLDGATGWINSDGPIHLDQLRGKIVLLDFWTYCCINCHHVLPDLAKLEAKYKNQLVVIGVHTAKFEAEKDTENIRSKVREYGIQHPVANDANQVIWDRFGARSWPTLALIDATGQPARKFAGEGHYADLDAEIGRLVARARARGELDETPVEFPSEANKPSTGGLLYPGKVSADPQGKRLFVSDTGHNRIVVTDLNGQFIEAIGSGKGTWKDGDFATASFQRPQGTCLFEDILYVADTENHAIRAVDFKSRTVKTVAGTGEQSHAFDGSGPGTSTAISSPWDVLPLPGTRVLAVAMAGPHEIWKYDIARGTISHWAGSGHENILDGALLQARFAQPSGLATDGQHLFIADSEVSGLRSINLTTADHRVSTIVGVGLFGFGDVDGTGATVRLQHCLGLAYGDGKLFVADTYNNKIKVCDPKTKTVQTLVGTHERGTDDQPPQFNEPGGLALVGDTLYVADTNNHEIRAVDLSSKQVRTLDLASVKAPARPKVPRFTNATQIEAAATAVRPGNELGFEVNLPIPPGYKISAEAPLVVLIETNPADAIAADSRGTPQNLDGAAKTFMVKIPLSRQMPTGSSLTAKVSVSAFVCLPNSLCTVKNYVWTVPITFDAVPAGPIQLTAPK